MTKRKALKKYNRGIKNRRIRAEWQFAQSGGIALEKAVEKSLKKCGQIGFDFLKRL